MSDGGTLMALEVEQLVDVILRKSVVPLARGRGERRRGLGGLRVARRGGRRRGGVRGGEPGDREREQDAGEHDGWLGERGGR